MDLTSNEDHQKVIRLMLEEIKGTSGSIYALLEDGKVIDYKMKDVVDAQAGAYERLKVKAESQGQTMIETDFKDLLVLEHWNSELQKGVQPSIDKEVKRRKKWGKFDLVMDMIFKHGMILSIICMLIVFLLLLHERF